jgi:organic radical activating enzyme
MSIQDWFNSEPAREFRCKMLGPNPASQCSRCYKEESHNGNSRRFKSNQKSVIFTRTAFQPSFEQSPGYPNFLHSDLHDGETLTSPIDIHVDLGNFCNLACKMCNPKASSRIASQEVRWGIESSRQYLGQDWTENTPVWNSFKQQLLDIPGLNNIHFMGGETLLTHRMEDLVDSMLAANRTDLCFSFVTNGTVYKPDLMRKLSHFRRVGIEVSIESMTAHNAYQRQGTDTQLVLDNIQRYREICNGDSITVTLRPAPSALTIGSYPTLLQYAIDNQLIVKSNLCVNPSFLAAEILPSSIRAAYRPSYDTLLDTLADAETSADYNASDPNNWRSVIREQALMCRDILLAPERPDADQQQRALVQHCERWDQVYGLNARDLYPEWQDMLDRHGYTG